MRTRGQENDAETWTPITRLRRHPLAPRATTLKTPSSRTLEDRRMTRVYLVRHADVENPRHILYGHLPGFPLSEHGRAQAAPVRRLASHRPRQRPRHSPPA